MKYYSLKNILEKKARYNVIFGERSNGKTYAVLKLGLEAYSKDGSQLAIVRRWQDDLRGKRSAVMFQALEDNGEIEKITKGEWTSTYYYGGRWWLCRYDLNEKGVKERVTSSEPFAFGFAISAVEHDKSTAYPKIRTVLFDEFLTRGGYLNDEFVLYMNVLSTIIRQRTDVTIFMLGNTVNQYSPYFDEMGLKHIKEMKPGDIDVYDYGDSGLRVAVEYADMKNNGKPSDVYFAFDNPKLHMITNGAWEIDIYPHCPTKIHPKDIQFIYFIVFSGDTLQCEIVRQGRTTFTYIHRKTTPIKDEDNDIIYSTENDSRPNWRRKISKPVYDFERKIWWFFQAEKVFYQDNTVGEIVRNYLVWARS